MTQPSLRLIPMHAAIAAGRSVTLDVLVKIEPPPLDLPKQRPPLNLGFVLDRSGSMHGQKIKYAGDAIAYAVGQLLPSDRLSLTVFNNRVKTKIPSTLATDKQQIYDLLTHMKVGGSTALHAGWVNGGIQVSEYLDSEHLNHVILLSDGLANVGETNPDQIANDVHGLCQQGVTTSVLGVGADYDEDLLDSMARSGDGNFFHIDAPEQLPDIFETELQGLIGTVAHSVTLAATPMAGTVLSQVLNDLERTDTGALKLPNLRLRDPLQVVLRLRIPSLEVGTNVLNVDLNWQTLDQSEPQQLQTTLYLDVVSPEQLSDFPADPVVQEQVALLMAARARQEAIAFADQGDWDSAIFVLRDSTSTLGRMGTNSDMIVNELATLTDLTTGFESGERRRARKQAMAQKYHLSRSRASSYGQKRDRQSES
ncbi:MAG: VWA domain-containing protein [Cyanobacteria bacterium P01_H01_bin.121]